MSDGARRLRDSGRHGSRRQDFHHLGCHQVRDGHWDTRPARARGHNQGRRPILDPWLHQTTTRVSPKAPTTTWPPSMGLQGATWMAPTSPRTPAVDGVMSPATWQHRSKRLQAVAAGLAIYDPKMGTPLRPTRAAPGAPTRTGPSVGPGILCTYGSAPTARMRRRLLLLLASASTHRGRAARRTSLRRTDADTFALRHQCRLTEFARASARTGTMPRKAHT